MPFLINIKKYYVVFGMICLLAVLFSSWLASGINYFNLVSSSSDFQSIYSWHPLIKGVSLGNLFPSQPNINISAQAFLFYPYITLWIYGLMVWIVGMKMVVIISTVIFPIVSFYLLYKIFLRQLTEIWSVTISLTCLLAFSDWPFRSFLIGLIKGLPFDKLTTIQPLEIAHYPIPSLSVMVFLLLFYFSTQQKKMTFGRMTLYTSLWGLFSQIHLVDSLFGLAFWFIFFPIQLFKQSKKQLDSLFIKKIFSQILIGLLALLPIIFTWKKLSQYNSFEKIGLIVSGVGNGPDFFYISIYFLLPLFLTFIVFLIKKVDYYEILTRFIHVYVLLLVEFILVISSMFFSSSFEIDVIQNRIALFFLHFYYYTPFIYLVTRETGYKYSQGMESNEISRKFDRGLNFIFNRFDKIYLPLIIFFLFLFSGSSSYNNYKYYKKNVASTQKIIVNEYNEISNFLPEGSVLISETPATNLLASLDFNKYYRTLWINSFSHNVHSYKILDRLLLYTKIFNWPKEKVLQFFSPGNLQEARGAVVNLSKQKIHKSGVGYWLVNHKRKMDNTELNQFLFNVSKRYDNINIKSLLRELSVTHIYSFNKISADIKVKNFIKLENGFLYNINN